MRNFFLYPFLFFISCLQAEWLPPQRLSLYEQKGIFSQVAIDSDGNQFAIWQGVDNNHSIIQASTKPYRGDWQVVPDRLSLGEEEVGLPQVVIDKTGLVNVVWDQFDGKNFIIHASTKSPKGAWQAIPDRISPVGESAFNPRLAVDSFGNKTVIWEKFDGKHFLIHAVTKPAGGLWQSVPDSLSSPNENACFPQVVMDSHGNATAIWHQCGTDHVTSIFASSKPYGGSWQVVPDLLSLPNREAFDLQATVDADGCVIVAWNGSDGTVWVNQKQKGGQWQGSPDLLSSPGRSGSYPQVAADGLGHAAVVWSELQGGRAAIQFAMKEGQGNWQRVSHSLSDLDRNVSHPQVAMNDRGSICLAWCERDGNHDRVRVATKSLDGEWMQEPEFLSPSGHHALFPRLAFHPNGMPVVTWQQLVYEDVFIQAAEKINLLPPRQFTGKVLRKYLASWTEYLHSFKWKKSLSSSVDHYRLFKNDRLVAKISKNRTLRWTLHHQSRSKKQVYTLVAVDREGWESPPLRIVLPSSKI